MCLKYKKQKLTEQKGETDKSTIIVGDFNTSLSIVGRTTRQRIGKDTEKRKNMIIIVDIYTTFHPEKVLFSSAYRTFNKIDHILGHKTNLSKVKRIEIIKSMFSDHKLETNNRMIMGKSSNCKFISILLNNPWVKKEVSKEI